MSSSVAAKPPNILVLQHRSRVGAENLLFQSVKEDLVACLGSEKYVVYPLATEDLGTTPWKDNCLLLVVPATAHVTSPTVCGEVLDFLVKRGSRLLSMNAALNSAVGHVTSPPDPVHVGGGHVCRVVAEPASSGIAFRTVTLPLAGSWDGAVAPKALETACVLARTGMKQFIKGAGRW